MATHLRAWREPQPAGELDRGRAAQPQRLRAQVGAPGPLAAQGDSLPVELLLAVPGSASERHLPLRRGRRCAAGRQRQHRKQGGEDREDGDRQPERALRRPWLLRLSPPSLYSVVAVIVTGSNAVPAL